MSEVITRLVLTRSQQKLDLLVMTSRHNLLCSHQVSFDLNQ